MKAPKIQDRAEGTQGLTPLERAQQAVRFIEEHKEDDPARCRALLAEIAALQRSAWSGLTADSYDTELLHKWMTCVSTFFRDRLDDEPKDYLGWLQSTFTVLSTIDSGCDPYAKACEPWLMMAYRYVERRRSEEPETCLLLLRQARVLSDIGKLNADLAQVCHWITDLVEKDNLAQDESKSPYYTKDIMGETAAFRAAAAEEGFSVGEFRKIVNRAKAAKAELTEREAGKLAKAKPRAKLNARDLSGPQVVAVIEDSTLGRLHRRYTELRATVELPKDGFNTLDQAKAAGRLASTFDNLQARREKLGLEPLPNDARVTEARRLKSLFYYHQNQARQAGRSGRSRRAATLG